MEEYTMSQPSNKNDLILMKCGCVAMAVCRQRNGVVYDPPIPACAIHDCVEPAEEQPDLTGREAQCTMCGKPAPSSIDLPFFEYRGPGSPFATEKCGNCGYHKTVHEGTGCYKRTNEPVRGLCIHRGQQFTPIGDQPDEYYCGCRGWE